VKPVKKGKLLFMILIKKELLYFIKKT